MSESFSGKSYTSQVDFPMRDLTPESQSVAKSEMSDTSLVAHMHDFAESTSPVFRIGHERIVDYFQKHHSEDVPTDSHQAVSRGVTLLESVAPLVNASWSGDVDGTSAESAAHAVLTGLNSKNTTPRGLVFGFQETMPLMTEVIETDLRYDQELSRFALLGAALQQRITVLAIESHIARSIDTSADMLLVPVVAPHRGSWPKSPSRRRDQV